VRHRAYIQTILVRIPQRTSDDGLFLVPDYSVRRLVVSPSTHCPSCGSSHGGRPTTTAAWPCGSPTFCFCSRTRRPATTKSASVRLHRHPQTGASRQMFPLSTNSPAFSLLTLGHSLRCWSRAPSPQRTTTVRRGPRFCGTARLCFGYAALRVSAFRKSFRQISAQNADEKIFRTFRKSTAWPWERGTLASLRARVSRG
jgi:hypothetical protein